MKLALAQINPTVGDFAGNAHLIRDFAVRAAGQSADLVIFPELSVCGYPPADLLEKSSFLARAQQTLDELAASTANGPALLVGAALAADIQPNGRRARNVAALLSGGKVTFTQQKMLLPFYDIFDEQRYFEPAPRQTLTLLNGAPLAITICEDAWNDKAFWPHRLYSVDPVDELMRQWATLPDPIARGPRVILNISASPYWAGKRDLRCQMLAAIARRHRAFVVMVNQVGGNDSLIFDGSSLVLSPAGEVLAQAASFAEDLILFDLAAAHSDHTATAAVPHSRAVASRVSGKEDSSRDVSRGMSVESTTPDPGGPAQPESESSPAQLITPYSPSLDIPAVYSALVLGTRDYVRKCGFSKALVALSGGIDSALVAAIAVDALGPENVLGVGMPSEFSSTGSISDAEKLAQNLGIRFDLVAIHDIFTRYQSALAPLFAGTPFGLAEENLQPRIRGALLMAVSNKFGALVLTTGNKSEMATGYCTLYGDMVGALAVIGDVFKTRVYSLARYINRDREIIPVDTITKPPSAELRPGQLDTDSLPPYEILDPILEAYVERYRSAEEILAELTASSSTDFGVAHSHEGVSTRVSGKPAEQGSSITLSLIRRVLSLVERAEYKRQQAAPILKITQKSFGTGRRFPIAVKVEI